MVRGFAGRVKPAEAVWARQSTAKGTLLFSDLGLTDVRKEPGVGGAAMGVMLPGFAQAEGAVHGQADFTGVRVLLAVVLPPADRAQPQGAGRLQRLVPATRAAKTSLCQSPHDCMDENRD